MKCELQRGFQDVYILILIETTFSYAHFMYIQNILLHILYLEESFKDIFFNYKNVKLWYKSDHFLKFYNYITLNSFVQESICTASQEISRNIQYMPVETYNGFTKTKDKANDLEKDWITFVWYRFFWHSAYSEYCISCNEICAFGTISFFHSTLLRY